MIAVLIKFLVPIVGFYFLQRWFRQTFLAAPGSGREAAAGSVYPRKRRAKGDVIEICPECGHVQEKGHRCG